MSNLTRAMMMGAAGAAADATYVDDVFSTYLYEGNGGTQSINNGIDLAGEGGLVWMKRRSGADSHILMDTLRPNKVLRSNGTAAEVSTTTTITSFNANGFSLGNPSQSGVNDNGEDIASWTFRKAPGFFDVVTFQKTSGRMGVAHSLGSVPGMIIVKNVDSSQDWYIYHRNLTSNAYYLIFNTAAQVSNSGVWNAETPSSTEFAVGSVLTTGDNYVAYIFAHDDASFGTDGDESIIKCGSYTGTAATNNFVNVGFEPQWVMAKSAGSSQPWFLLDNMRGVSSDGVDAYFYANSLQAESNVQAMDFHPTGFSIMATGDGINQNNTQYIYMAIRRPHKPPEAATEVFALDTGNSSSSTPCFDSGFPVDFAFRHPSYASSGNNPRAYSRLQGTKILYTPLANAEGTETNATWDSMSGYYKGDGSAAIAWMFKRAPGFMDVVAYTGTSSNRAVNHNLEAVPELMIVKVRNHSEDWNVYNFIDGPTKYLRLNLTQDIAASSSFWNNTAPTSSVFSLGTYIGVNGSGKTYVAYLFATLPGISKVGTYTGTGNAINVNCGFTNGARFVLIKRRDSPGGDWYVWDTLRGIASGNDPYLLLNTTAAQVTNTDYIDPLGTGFTVTASAPAALNTSGGTYLFLAIA
jgi:hypothetical protein